MRHPTCALLILLPVLLSQTACTQDVLLLSVPKLESKPVIDGDLGEWKRVAFSDGVWDMRRVSQSPWYDAERNRLTDHNEAVSIEDDLSARYYMAWDDEFLYLGAEVNDNVNDVVESRHAPKRWYYKDAIAWFIEAPSDDVDESFGQGDHAFAFVIDTSRPDYGAWWRHGTADTTFIEQPLPHGSARYAIQMNPWNTGNADYTLEVRIDMRALLSLGDLRWTPPAPGDVYRMMIVHCDPDGGEYGGHLLIYGSGDSDITWTKMILAEPAIPIERKEK